MARHPSRETRHGENFGKIVDEHVAADASGRGDLFLFGHGEDDVAGVDRAGTDELLRGEKSRAPPRACRAWARAADGGFYG